MFTGYSGTLFRQSIGNVFFFGTYEGMKDALIPQDTRGNPFTLLCCGTVAGATYWTLVYPVDVVKAQVQICSKGLGYTHHATQTLKEYGWRGFFRGFGTTLVRCLPVNGTSIMVYELSQQYFASE